MGENWQNDPQFDPQLKVQLINGEYQGLLEKKQHHMITKESKTMLLIIPQLVEESIFLALHRMSVDCGSEVICLSFGI